MPLFTINTETCNRDGLCAAECPVGCIVFERDRFPVPHEKKSAYCINCGHCMAICPSGALQLEQFAEGAVAKERNLRVTSDQVIQFLKGRRSIRAFRDEPLEKELLEELLDLTQFAPSGHNARPVQWAVASTPEAVHRVAEATAAWMREQVQVETPLAAALHLAGIVRAWDDGTDIICRHAPALAVAYGPKQGITPREDGVIAVTYLELAATGAGLGACWCGYVHIAANQDEALRGILGIADDAVVSGALMLGRSVRRYNAMPPRPKAIIKWV